MNLLFRSILIYILVLSSTMSLAASNAAADYISSPPISPDTSVEMAMKKLYDAQSPIEYSINLAAVQKLVDNGNAEAAFRLGRHFHLENPNPDFERALKLYKVAEKQNHFWAINNIGLMYETGSGVPQDITKATSFYTLAASKGEPHAFINLTKLFALGKIAAPPDISTTVTWYMQMADIYERGRYNLPIDLQKATDYYVLSAEKNDQSAFTHLGKLVVQGKITSPPKLANNARWYRELGYAYICGCYVVAQPEKSVAYYQQAANMGDVDSINALGTAYAYGKGVPIDKEKGVKLWMQAAEKGQCKAFAHLGDAYDHGWSVVLDEKKATEYYIQAVNCTNESDTWDLWKLGTRYRNGIGIAQNCAKAVSLFEAAAKDGYVDLGYLYQNGCGDIKPNAKKAFETYLMGAKLGVPLSQNNVGAMLKHGFETTPPDRVRAYAWLSLAKENGNEIAKNNLSDFTTMFSKEDREAGELHLMEIRKIINNLTEKQFYDSNLY